MPGKSTARPALPQVFLAEPQQFGRDLPALGMGGEHQQTDPTEIQAHLRAVEIAGEPRVREPLDPSLVFGDDQSQPVEVRLAEDLVLQVLDEIGWANARCGGW